VGSTDLGLLSVGDLARRRRSRQPDRVAFDGITYLMGENVARYARPVERMDLLRPSAGPELRALFYDVVFRLLCEGEQRANIMVGLPVEVMADREKGQLGGPRLQLECSVNTRNCGNNKTYDGVGDENEGAILVDELYCDPLGCGDCTKHDSYYLGRRRKPTTLQCAFRQDPRNVVKLLLAFFNAVL
jgi:hypothetical protein